MARPILVLQAFAAEGRSTRRSADEKAARALVSRSPDEITYPLEAEH
jgi:hypothetical protein